MIPASQDDVHGVIVGETQFRAILISPTGFQFTEWFKFGTSDEMVKLWARETRLKIIENLSEYRATELGLLSDWELRIY